MQSGGRRDETNWRSSFLLFLCALRVLCAKKSLLHPCKPANHDGREDHKAGTSQASKGEFKK